MSCLICSSTSSIFVSFGVSISLEAQKGILWDSFGNSKIKDSLEMP